jgi:hypothetical protein
MELATGNGALPAIRVLALQSADNPPNGDGRGIPSPLVIPALKRGVIRVQFTTSDPAIRQSVALAGSFITSVVAREWIPTRVIRISALEPGKTRANATHSLIHAGISLQPGVLDVATAIHEIGHIIEISHPPILLASKHFIARRAPKGGPARPLAEIMGDPNYENHEIAFPSNWRARGGTPYTGKFYGRDLNEAEATEVISTGLERMYSSPRSFFQQDADFFLFMTLTLQCRPSS